MKVMKKISVLYFLTILLLICPGMNGQDQMDKQSLAGSWLGRITAGGVSLRIVFNLAVIEKDSLIVTMDSPDQGVKNIKLGQVTLEKEKIRISAGLMLAEYNGTIKNDTLIEGAWKQGGNEFKLDLTRLITEFTLNRPQEPVPPFPYRTEEVTFTNNKFKINLAGTLTIPEGNGPFPAVILITGSGAQNRNEELMGHKPFMVIADYLSRKGIMVLRYDDRGVGGSQGDYLKATTADLSTDAMAAFNFLKEHPLADHKSIGLAGHSEGGLIAPMVAASDEKIAFIISLAGPGVRGEEIIHRQNNDISRISGIDEKQIKEGIELNRKLFSVLIKENDNKKAEEKMVSLYRKILTKRKATPGEIEAAQKQLNAGLNPVTYDWFRYFLVTDPAFFWKKVKCPVLALNGEKDLQVAAEINLNAIEKAVLSGGNSSIKKLQFPGLNHLFQHAKTGLPSEYGDIEETFSNEVLEIISDWILNQQGV